jgi:hypothetical protein
LNRDVDKFNSSTKRLQSSLKKLSKNTIKLPAARGKDKKAAQSTGPDKSAS